MPIYEYLCEACGMVNEKLQKVNDPPPARCDECGSRKLAKLVSRSAFQLKGGGWYSDLYASKKKEAPAKGGAEGASSPQAESTGDAKPDAKADAKGGSKDGSKDGAKSAAKPDAAATAPAAPVTAKSPAVDGPARKGRAKGG
jgi:putative FmdB family regulatory protein